MSDDEIKEQYKPFDERSDGVILVIAITHDNREHYGIFSTLAKAQAWNNTLSDDDYGGVIFSHHLVDEPDFGNTLKGKMT